MKKLFVVTSVLAALSVAAAAMPTKEPVAAAAMPTKESVERLLTDANVQRNLQAILRQMDAMSANAMNQAFHGRKLTPEARKLAEKLEAKMMADMEDELSWQKMKEIYVKVYSETFTQKEIDGLIAFYESPTGKAFVAKTPVVMQKTMVLMRGKIGPMVKRLQQDIQESVREVQAEERSTKGQSGENHSGAATPAAAGSGQAKGAGGSH